MYANALNELIERATANAIADSSGAVSRTSMNGKLVEVHALIPRNRTVCRAATVRISYRVNGKVVPKTGILAAIEE